MPRHKPIRFKDPSFPEEIRKHVEKFIEKHPVAVSITRTILATAIIGGVITTAAVFPGLVKITSKAIARKRGEKYARYRKLWQSFYDLRRRNIFELIGESPEGELIYKFTEEGKLITKKFLLETLELEPPSRWNGKWRVIIFDIPEKYKKTRKIFQTKLRELSFYPLQKSVWVYPFPCEKEINFLKDFLNIKPYVEIITTNEMPSGKALYCFRKDLRKFI